VPAGAVLAVPARRIAPGQGPPVFQATNDAATPYEGGVTVHHLLKHSSMVVEQGGGNHAITLSGNTCLDEYLANQLSDGTSAARQRRGRRPATPPRGGPEGIPHTF
jgi:CubicO group peptidase (beta-lactamase class C family)